MKSPIRLVLAGEEEYTPTSLSTVSTARDAFVLPEPRIGAPKNLGAMPYGLFEDKQQP